MRRKYWIRILPNHLQSFSAIQFYANSEQRLIAGTRTGQIISFELGKPLRDCLV